MSNSAVVCDTEREDLKGIILALEEAFPDDVPPYFRASTLFWPEIDRAFVVTGKQVGFGNTEVVCGMSPLDTTAGDYALLYVLERWVQTINSHADECGGDVVAVLPWPLYLNSDARSTKYPNVEIRLMPLFDGALRIYLQVHPGWSYSLRMQATGKLIPALDSLELGSVIASRKSIPDDEEGGLELTTDRVNDMDRITGFVDALIEQCAMEKNPEEYVPLV